MTTHRRVWVENVTTKHPEECAANGTQCAACGCCEHCFHDCTCGMCCCGDGWHNPEPVMHVVTDVT